MHVLCTQSVRSLYKAFGSETLVIPALAYAAQPFFQNASRGLSVREQNMDVPISLAIVMTAGMSLCETFFFGQHAYFDAAQSLTFFQVIGRNLDHRSRKAAASAAAQLSALEVPCVMCLRDGTRQMVDFAEMAIGDLIQVLHGGRIPVDRIIGERTSQLDRSLLTGESRPVAACMGAAATAGEVNMTGLSRVSRLVDLFGRYAAIAEHRGCRLDHCLPVTCGMMRRRASHSRKTQRI